MLEQDDTFEAWVSPLCRAYDTVIWSLQNHDNEDQKNIGIKGSIRVIPFAQEISGNTDCTPKLPPGTRPTLAAQHDTVQDILDKKPGAAVTPGRHTDGLLSTLQSLISELQSPPKINFEEDDHNLNDVRYLQQMYSKFDSKMWNRFTVEHGKVNGPQRFLKAVAEAASRGKKLIFVGGHSMWIAKFGKYLKANALDSNFVSTHTSEIFFRGSWGWYGSGAGFKDKIDNGAALVLKFSVAPKPPIRSAPAHITDKIKSFLLDQGVSTNFVFKVLYLVPIIGATQYCEQYRNEW